MPLIQSGSKEAVGENIQKEQEAGRPHDQAVAIALETQRRNGGGSKVGVKGGRPGVKK